MADPQSCIPKTEMSPVIDMPASPTNNIIENHDFSKGLHSWQPNCCHAYAASREFGLLNGITAVLHPWHPNCCHAYVASRESGLHNGITANTGERYAVVTARTKYWQGLEHDVTGKVTVGTQYTVSAYVRVCGRLQGSTEVQATLKLKHSFFDTKFLSLGRIPVTHDRWEKVEGSFCLSNMPKRVVFYLEGPPPGVDLLIYSVVISSRIIKQFKGIRDNMDQSQIIHDTCIISNHDFSSGLSSWFLNSCDGYVVSGEPSLLLKGVTAMTGTNFAVTTNGTEAWQGLYQVITNKVSVGSVYNISAYVRVWGGRQEPAPVIATLKLEHFDSPTSYVLIGRASVLTERWEKLEGSFSLDRMPKRVVFFIEGPSAGQDLLIDSVRVYCSSL